MNTHPQSDKLAAIKIQSAYRSHVVRKLVKKISAIDSSFTKLQFQIQRQETVHAIRNNPKERVRINEALMGLLLTLDGIPGIDPVVRELRRNLSRKIVGMQEIVDTVSQEEMNDGWDRFWVWEMEEEICRKKGGDELERFCAEKLGFRCFERFLHQ